MGLNLENANKDMLGSASKVVITKDSTLIVTDGSTQEAVKNRVSQMQRLVDVCRLSFTILKFINQLRNYVIVTLLFSFLMIPVPSFYRIQ